MFRNYVRLTRSREIFCRSSARALSLKANEFELSPHGGVVSLLALTSLFNRVFFLLTNGRARSNECEEEEEEEETINGVTDENNNDEHIKNASDFAIETWFRLKKETARVGKMDACRFDRSHK